MFVKNRFCHFRTKPVNVKGGMALRNGIWNGMPEWHAEWLRNGETNKILKHFFRFGAFLNFINFTTVYNSLQNTTSEHNG